MTDETPQRWNGWPATHPGEVLRDDVLPALGIAVKDAAFAMHVSRQALQAILAEKAGITPEMAVRIGKFCGNGPRVWLAMQHEYDLWKAERALAGIVETIPTMAAPHRAPSAA